MAWGTQDGWWIGGTGRALDRGSVAPRPAGLAGERQVELFGLVRMGRVVDVRPEHQDPAGDRPARDRAAQPDELGPAVALQERGAEIRRRIALPPGQHVGMGGQHLDERCGRGDRRPPRGIAPGQDREGARGLRAGSPRGPASPRRRASPPRCRRGGLAPQRSRLRPPWRCWSARSRRPRSCVSTYSEITGCHAGRPVSRSSKPRCRREKSR